MQNFSVDKCPSCGSKDVYPRTQNTIVDDSLTEIKIPSHCADCGYSYWIIYQPDRIEDRQ